VHDSLAVDLYLGGLTLRVGLSDAASSTESSIVDEGVDDDPASRNLVDKG